MKEALAAMKLYWCEWKLKLNCSKTKVLVFSKGRRNLHNYEFEFGGENDEVVADYNYLGVLFNYNGRFCKGEMELTETATRAMRSLMSKCRKIDLQVDIKLESFAASVTYIDLCISNLGLP